MTNASHHADSALARITQGSFRLGPWTVRPALNRLERDAGSVHVGRKVMDLLLLLAAAPGSVVSKETLVARVWNDAHVSDEVITTTIYALRRALGDQARRPRFVATVRGRGYRLVASPAPLDRAPRRSPPAAAEVAAEAGRRSPARRPWRVAATAVAAIAAAAIVAFGVALAGGRSMAPGPVRPAAALPPVAAPAAGLDRGVAEALALGRHFLRRGTLADLEKARRHLAAAVEGAPGHAPAHLALAEAWLEAAPDLPPPAQQAAFARAARSARRALAADRDLAGAHRALGWIALQHRRDPEDAARSFDRVEAGTVGGERHLARYLSARGHHRRARAAMVRHVTAEPASKSARLALAEVLYRARRPAEALAELDRAEELDGSDPEVARMRADVLAALGHHSDALQACLRDLELSGVPAATSSALGSAFTRAGFAAAQRLLFEQLASAVEPEPDPVRLARLSARLGDADTALAWLDRANAQRRADLVWLGVDPAYERVRATPRFRDLVARLGLDAVSFDTVEAPAIGLLR